MKKAIWLTAFWISLALAFSVGLLFFKGYESFLTFLTGYTLEYSLSIDNLFIFALIFKYFALNPEQERKVLFLGIVGAIVLRTIVILFGVILISYFHWILYIFALFLLYGSYKMFRHKEIEIAPEKNIVLRCFRKIFPITKNYHGTKFVVREKGKIFFTPLVIVLVFVEVTDLIFAMDSIPAIFAITLDPFIVLTSNIFAVLGLRSLYFVLSYTFSLFRYLNYGLALTLLFVAFKMIAGDFIKIPTLLSLFVIICFIGGSIVASLLLPKRSKR